jgi:hypothetical protein
VISFDEAVDRLQSSLGLSRNEALDRLHLAYEEKDPELENISGLEEGLNKVRGKSILARGGAGILTGTLGPLEAGARLLEREFPTIGTPLRRGLTMGEELAFTPGRGFEEGFSPDQPMLSERARSFAESETETTPYVEGLGEILGSALPFGLTEEALTAVPQLAVSPMLRRAVAGGILGGVDTGTLRGVTGGALGGAFLPPVIETALGLAGHYAARLGAKIGESLPSIRFPEVDISDVTPQSILGRPSYEVPELPEKGLVDEPTTNLDAEPQIGTRPEPESEPETTSPSDLLERAQRTILGPTPTSASETLEAAMNVLRGKSTPIIKPEEGQFVGTQHVRTGQPFFGTKTVLLQENRGRVYVNADSPHAELGTPGAVDVQNPMVLNVHDTPYRDALEQVFPNSPNLLNLYDQSETPNEIAREVLGRFAKRKGYDSVILRSKDPRNDIILDFKGFESQPTKGLSKGLSLEVQKSQPPKSIFARKISPEVMSKQQELPFGVRTLEEVARDFGFDNVKDLTTAIKAHEMSPFEMLRAGGKKLLLPMIQTFSWESPEGGMIEGQSSASFRQEFPDLHAVLQTFTDRFPRLMDLIGEVKVRLFVGDDVNSIARTYVHQGRAILEFNPAFFPTSPKGEVIARKLGFDPKTEGREYMATTLEHELTHVAQFWAHARGLRRTFHVPDMTSEEPLEVAKSEFQAEVRALSLQDFFMSHRELQRVVSKLPDEVKDRVFLESIVQSRRVMRPYVVRKVNQLKGISSTEYFARKAPELTPEDMDLFDNESRSLPLGTWTAPDKVLDPAVKDLLDQMSRYGIKFGNQFRPPYDVSDHPAHLQFISRVNELANERVRVTELFNKRLGKILRDYGAKDNNYDNLWEAVEGLRRMPDGTLTQTITGLDEKTAKAAVQLREQIYDRAYEYITGIDRKAPAILRDLGLEDSPKQWMRIKLIQLGQRGVVKNPLANEFTAAKRLEGMLNFDESHDFRNEFIDGYITHQPIANERAELLDQIAQVDRIAKETGYADPAGQALRQERIKRLTEIEVQLAQQKIKSLPARDVVPKKQFFGPMNIKDHPGAAEILVDKDIPTIAGRYIDGIVSKRFFDQVLSEFDKVKNQLPPSVRDYNVNFINNLRGVRGFREDSGLVAFINAVNEKAGRATRVSVKEVRRFVGSLMQLTNFLKLGLTPIRFPLVLMTHTGMTTWPVSGTKALVKGLSYFLAKPKLAVLEAMAQGVIERDSEFIGALDEIKPTASGKFLRLWQAGSKYADYFRKTVSYHTFRLQALEPGFKPNSVVKTFVKDVPGRNLIQMSRDYARAATDVTQFRLRAEGKAQAFVGGTLRRSMGQFKQWPVNLAALYKNILRSKDPAMIGRMVGAMWFFGGATALSGGELMYNVLRSELLKFGYILPKETGWQIVANQLGVGGSLEDVDIMSLRDPIGLPRSRDEVLPWIAGPMVGSIYDLWKDWDNSRGDSGKEAKAVLSAISPQLRASIDALEEFRQGGVRSPAGQLLALRQPSNIIIRGLDLSPSIKSQRFQFKEDIITALNAGHPETAQKLFTQARDKGVVFGPKDLREIRSRIKQLRRQAARVEADPESLIR